MFTNCIISAAICQSALAIQVQGGDLMANATGAVGAQLNSAAAFDCIGPAYYGSAMSPQQCSRILGDVIFLVYVDQDVNMDQAFPVLQTITGDLIIEGDGLKSVSSDILQSVEGDIKIRNNDDLESIQFRALQNIGGGLIIDFNNALNRLNMNNIRSMGWNDGSELNFEGRPLYESPYIYYNGHIDSNAVQCQVSFYGDCSCDNLANLMTGPPPAGTTTACRIERNPIN